MERLENATSFVQDPYYVTINTSHSIVLMQLVYPPFDLTWQSCKRLASMCRVTAFDTDWITVDSDTIWQNMELKYTLSKALLSLSLLQCRLLGKLLCMKFMHGFLTGIGVVVDLIVLVESLLQQLVRRIMHRIHFIHITCITEHACFCFCWPWIIALVIRF